METTKRIFSVSELNTKAKLILEQEIGLVWLEAEISNLSRPASGHWYFSLKDKKSQIRCAFFKNRNRLLDFTPEDGQQLRVRGRISLYEARGDYQLIVDHVEPLGKGHLQKIYEETKQRLYKAGFFDKEHKQTLPCMPQQIGLVTSPSGAAIQDALHILKRRFPKALVVIYPVIVQGEDAAMKIIEAVKSAIRRKECDVLLLIRGGGSLEDLWPFNDEQLATAIFECPIPIVTGIGHEVDDTIADFVADVRAPTPSAAAEIAVPDQSELVASIQQQQYRLIRQVKKSLNNASQQMNWYTRHFQQFHPKRQLSVKYQQLNTLSRHLQQTIRTMLNNSAQMMMLLNQRIDTQSPSKLIKQYRERIKSHCSLLDNSVNNTLQLSRYRLDSRTRSLDAVSPIATLSRGYSISTRVDTGACIRQASELTEGELMKTQLKKGSVISRIESIDA